jgi:ribosomal protein S4
MLTILAGWRKFSDLKSQIANLRDRSERISKQLHGWIENLTNSDITGQRRLDKKAKNRYANKKEREQFLEELRRISEKAEKDS